MRATRHRKWLLFFTTLLIWLATTGLWAWIWYRFYAGQIDLPFYRRGNWVVVGIYGVLLFFITHFYGGYRVGYSQRGALIFSGFISITVGNALTYLQVLAIGRMLPNLRNFLPFLWMTAVDFLLIWVWATVSSKLYLRLNPPRHLLMIYGGESMAQSLIPKFIEREDKYIIQETCNIESGVMQVLEKIDRYRAVLVCDVKSTHRNRILKYCYQKGIRVYMTPKISDILIRGSQDIHLFDSPLLLSRNEGLSAEQRLVKRCMDLVASGLGLLLASPLMALIVIAIKIEDHGPVLYSQERLTEGGRVFRLHKFRSMVVDAEKHTGARLAGKYDDRITGVGRVLRVFRLDELPQLVNILKGEMSLVGPRPERPELASRYREEIEEFDFRLKVKAGLTGYAQVQGRYNTTIYDKLKMDLTYISHYSLLLDVKLILQTVKIVFMKQSAEGVVEVPLAYQQKDKK